MDVRNLVEDYFKKKIPKKPADFIIAVTGNLIECKGERQKEPKYIYVFRLFRFLSPTKLNRDEQAGNSEAHSIQPLCLRGVGTCSLLRVWSFEGVRPWLTLVPRNSDYKENPQGFRESSFLTEKVFIYLIMFLHIHPKHEPIRIRVPIVFLLFLSGLV